MRSKSKFTAGFWSFLGKVRLRAKLFGKSSPKVILGSGGTGFPGWIATDIGTLNVLAKEDWVKWFKPGSISILLAEHVWEHLSKDEGHIAAAYCFEFLKPGGRLRLAVPDGFHPDPAYIDYVKVGRDGHQMLYTYETISELLAAVGFDVRLLEYFDRVGHFRAIPWDPAEGYIHRSLKFDERNKSGMPNYTSLIVEAIKPSQH